MASAAAMASVAVGCVQNVGSMSSSFKADSARFSTVLMAPSRTVASPSSVKAGGNGLAAFLRRPTFESRPAISVAATCHSRILGGKPIGMHGSALPLRQRRVEPSSTVCMAAAADAEGDGIAISSGLQKPSQGFADKFPALVTGFYFFMWSSYSADGWPNSGP